MHSPADWWRRVADKQAVAEIFSLDADHALEGWEACGFAVEFALKGLIHEQRGFDAWPGRSLEPGLHTHDLGRLMMLAGLVPQHVPSPVRASLKVVLSWSIAHRYRPRPLPREEARQMFEASFGRNGVIPWLRSL